MLRSSPKLKGFDIPSLFADDTTVYLSEEDSFQDLAEILATWCLASIIVPLGVKEYRDRLILTRKLNHADSPIPDYVTINEDGKTTRILAEETGVWLPLIERIENILDRCTDRYPTVEAKRHMINLTVGSITQFLTAANGMPESIAKRLTKLQKEFLSTPINRETRKENL
ncbi:hypothetical protein F5880DRAFT_1624786 [Lentinula raphanica]|nr:hypothetical protein F5880DRAFT_1624786 [Lentinula raphanica]